MIVVIVGDDDGVYGWDVFDLAGWVCVSLWTQPG